MTSSIPALLSARAKHNPEKIALTAPGRKPLTYSRLCHHIEEVTAQLRRIGINRCDRVAVILRDCPEAAMAFLAISSGASYVPLNPAYSPSELREYLARLQPKALVIEAPVSSAIQMIAQEQKILLIQLFANEAEAAGIFFLDAPISDIFREAEPAAIASDEALVLLSSGTTAQPKIISLTHQNILVAAQNIALSLALTSRDRSLLIAPLFHIQGLVSGLLSSLVAEGSVICPFGFDIEQFFVWLEALEPTWYTTVPTVHQSILDRAAVHPFSGVHTLRFLRSTAAPLTATLWEKLEQVFQVPVINAYGMTEAAPCITSHTFPPQKRKIGSVGVAVGTEIAIIDDEGNSLPAGAIGEIIVRGANIATEKNNPSLERLSLLGQIWLHTGDMGYLDAEGYLFLSGRKKEIINRGGEKITPLEVDRVLTSHPAIADALTFAFPHPRLGEDIGAAIVLDRPNSVDVAEIQRFAATKLAPFKVPRQIVFVKEIPLSATGKPQRIGLAEKLQVKATEAPHHHHFLPPRTPTESTLASIWTQILRVDTVGVEDNFWELGGDSLSVMQGINLIEKTCQKRLSFPDFFENPTVATLASKLEKMDSQRVTSANLSRRRPSCHLPLSYSQQQLWLRHQFDPQNPRDNLLQILHLQGSLDPEIFEKSFNEILSRHEIWRTSFSISNEQPVQIVHPHLYIHLPRIDLRNYDPSHQKQEIYRQGTEDVQCHFNLTELPLLRVKLFQLASEDHVLLLTLHHLIFDGCSMDVFLRELTTLYDAFSQGQPSPLFPLPVQYGDFAQWQQQYLQPAKLAVHLDYWRQQLAGISPLLTLPNAHPRPPVQTSHGRRSCLELPSSLHCALKQFSQQEEVTLFMTLLSVFGVLLYRYTQEDDIAIGIPIAGRNCIETENLIGVFINTLVLRMSLDGHPTIRQMVKRVRQVALEAYLHQDCPFSKVVEALQPQRDLSYEPLVQFFFQLRNIAQHKKEEQTLSIEEWEGDRGVASYDLSLDIFETEEGLSCWFEYNTALFEADVIEKMQGHFRTLLEAAVSFPDQKVTQLPLLTPQESRQIAHKWQEKIKDSADNYPPECLHHLFEAQVKKSPKAIALICGQVRLTYEDLNQGANQVAHYLRRRGVGPEKRVGICFEPGIMMIVGVLAILKAGGAYVPIDPQEPPERIAFRFRDAAMEILLTQASMGEKLPPFEGEMVSLETQDPFSKESQENLNSGVTPDHLALIIYTSGSTGQPKGVMLPHRGISHYLRWRQQRYPAQTSDRLLQRTSLCFDLSVWEIFWTLSVGAQLVLVPDGSQDVETVVRLIEEEQITICQMMPTLLQTVLQTTNSVWGQSLRSVSAGGESLSSSLCEMFFARLKAQLLHGYGPSEASICVTLGEVTPKTRMVNIGDRVADREIYLLDPQLQPVPVGIPGEIYLGGVGLARGYLNQPQLTAQRFIPHPFKVGLDRKLYRTGDLARYLKDGSIEFLGRSDRQVKLRGFRIELGEVETALVKHPQVRKTVVLVREVGSVEEKRNQCLVAYVVLQENQSLTSQKLIDFLQQKLPYFMIPNIYVKLSVLPQLPNGKINYRALPEPDLTLSQPSVAYVSPRNSLEQAFAEIWAQVLGKDNVGINDNFFALGGHSLLAVQVLSRIRQSLDINIPLPVFFQAPTIEQQSQYVTLLSQITQPDILDSDYEQGQL